MTTSIGQRKCFEPSCDQPPTKRVIIEQGALTLSFLMCAGHAARMTDAYRYPNKMTVASRDAT